MSEKASQNAKDELRASALAAYAAGDHISSRLLEQVKKIAAAESTVLIQGESGTGKDLIASLLHFLGPRPEQPLLKLIAQAFPASCWRASSSVMSVARLLAPCK